MEIYDEEVLSPFELIRQRNIIKNYEFMIACGLPAKPLIYVKRQEVPLEERFKYVSDDGDSLDSDDDEWTMGTKPKKEKEPEQPVNWDIRKKVKNPSAFFTRKAKEEKAKEKKMKGKKTNREEEIPILPHKSKGKKSIRERPKLPTLTNNNEDEELVERTLRYPRRCARVNYREEEVPDDDHYLFCEECADFYYGDCPVHGTLLPCGDNEVGEGNVKRSTASLPEGLEIKESDIANAGLGVFSMKTFDVGTTFGPYKGKKVCPDVPKDDVDTSYMWEIMKEGKIIYYINGKDERYGNWMRYINCSRVEEEQNLVALQYHGEIYYKVYKEIDVGSELLVWYGEDYARDLGIELDDDESEKVLVFKCKQCDISFAQPENLEHHEKYCRKRRKSNLNHHVSKSQLHNANNLNKGEVCGEQSDPKINLKAAMLVHNKDDKSFECDVCGKQFKRKDGLIRHKLIHTGEKPYKCEVCGKQFSQSSHLKEHTRIHTGENPYKCEVCGHQFAHKHNLNKHTRIHTGEKPYKCEVCGKQFTTRCDLKTHMRTHTGEKPYKCKVCGQQFTQIGSMNVHIRNVHNKK